MRDQSAFGPVLPTVAARGLAGPPPTPGWLGIEATQVVQDLTLSVPLSADKATLVRIYLKSGGSPSPFSVRGTLMASLSATPNDWTAIPSLGEARIDPAEDNKLSAKRSDLAKSLNFLIPASLTVAGDCTVVLDQLEMVAPDQADLAIPANPGLVMTFLETPPLRVHVIGLRYTVAGDASGTVFEPRALDYELLRSWLGRAYPSPVVEWSQAVLDAPQQWVFTADDVNSYLRALRHQDVLTGGTDGRTHYYGMVADGGGFMRGLASGIPQSPDPTTVASGPSGSADWGWDFDGSYADWYGAHELGHTYGRFHAQFCGAGGGAAYPYPNGQLSGNDLKFVGFDIGDPSHQIPMRALPGDQHHDVMTYCSNQWLSDFTYKAIRTRLVAEDALGAGPAPSAGLRGVPGMAAGPNPNAPQAIHFLAVVNLTQKSGGIKHVTPTDPSGPRPADPGPSPCVLRMLDANGALVAEVSVPLHLSPCQDAGVDETGIVDAIVEAPPGTVRLELLLDGQTIDVFDAVAPAAAVQNIRSTAPVARALAPPGVAPRPSGRAWISWTDPAAVGAGAGGGLRALGPAAAPTYMVQVSTDDGLTWKTVGLGLAQPEISLDRNLIAGADKVLVRVTSTNGFQSNVTEKSFSADDL